MPSETSRRGLLATVGALVCGVGGTGSRVRAAVDSAGVAPASAPDAARSFDPSRRGFGFRNWSTNDPVYPDHDHRTVSRTQIRRAIKRDWRDPFERLFGVDVRSFPAALVDALVEQVYVSANQLSATNGHCYGMVFAAQRYFEDPSSVPLGRRYAAEIDSPQLSATAGTDTAPVSDDVDTYQLLQLLSPYAWLGRRRMLDPERIEYAVERRAVVDAIDRYGTAGLTLVDTATRASHQVLAYAAHPTADGVAFDVYDPNYAARFYRTHDRPRILLRIEGDAPVVRRYDDEFDSFLYNRLDRSIAAEGAPVPETPHPAETTALGTLLSCLTVFTVDSPDVRVAVVGPNDRPVERDRGAFMDRTRTTVHALRYRYGASHGAYRVTVTAVRDATYTLAARAAGSDGAYVDADDTRTLAAGETHRFAVQVPDSPGDGELRRVDGEDRRERWPLVAVGGAVGAAVGGAAFHLAGRARRGESACGDRQR